MHEKGLWGLTSCRTLEVTWLLGAASRCPHINHVHPSWHNLHREACLIRVPAPGPSVVFPNQHLCSFPWPVAVGGMVGMPLLTWLPSAELCCQLQRALEERWQGGNRLVQPLCLHSSELPITSVACLHNWQWHSVLGSQVSSPTLLATTGHDDPGMMTWRKILMRTKFRLFSQGKNHQVHFKGPSDQKTKPCHHPLLRW